jgi:AcrR family transcriptional regulator
MAGMRELQRAETRHQILQAGLHLVRQSGFGKTTTGEIAKLVGKAHGTVFLHFATRDALVTEIVKAIGSGLTERLATLSSERFGLEDFLDAHLAVLGEEEALYSALLQELSTLPDNARAYVFAMQSGVSARLGRALQVDIDKGLARAFDKVALANIWIALTNHYLLNRDLFAPGESVIARHGKALKSQLVAIVEKDKSHA